MLALAIPSRALAQTSHAPAAEISFGWQYLYDKTFTSFTYGTGSVHEAARGWYGDLTLNATRALGVVFEFGQASWDETFPDKVGPGNSTTHRTGDAWLVGLRGSLRRSKVVPFAQVSIGASSVRNPALQLGAGTTLMITRPLGLRVEGAYRRLGFDLEHNQFLVSVGAVVALGG
jgi:hypothetical protein